MASQKPLHNRVDRKVLREQLAQSEQARTTVSFYKYWNIPDVQQFRDDLFRDWQELGVLGRTYVAAEGINAQISLPSDRFEAFRDHLYAIDWLNGLRLNVAVEDDGKSFFKLTIKIKEKIVADGIHDPAFDATNCGEHLKAAEFNEITDREDTLLVDMRNRYESEVGHFEGAVCPDVDTFREEIEELEKLAEQHKEGPIVMYCTGGIRCEKASAYLRHKGYDNVYQLEGGIIEYTRRAKEGGLRNKFIGKNFVFDERMAERISDDVIAQCHQCGKPADDHTNCANLACHTLFIQCAECAAKYDGTCGPKCQEIIHLPEEEQEAVRKAWQQNPEGFRKGRNVKSRFLDNTDG